MSPIFNMHLGRSSQRPHVGVFSGSPSFKPAAHFGVSLLFENINTNTNTNKAPHTDMADADQSANRTFAIVKPDALTPFKYQQINALIKLNEFEITRQKLVWLDDALAAALFPERAAAQDSGEWLAYITCAPSLALELAKADAPLFWQLTMGAEDPNDVGGRDSDSIRGIIATDRIRNAVDGSQEPEDAASQLRLAFSDAVPALAYDGFLMQRADEARCTLALIKPDVAQDARAVATIIGRITARGYAIKDRVEITLSHAQASAFYAEHAARPFFAGLVALMSSGPTIALLLEGDDVVRGWRMMVGPTSPAAARQQVPHSIRALLGNDCPRNAVHGSDSAEAAQRELAFFFHPRIQPEAEAEADDEAPTPAETAVDGCSVASVADAGSDDKKKKKKKPKRRNKRKQAVTVSAGGPAAAAFASDDSDDEHGPLSGDSSAPITPAATHIRFDQLMEEPVAGDAAPAHEAALAVEEPGADASDAAHEATRAAELAATSSPPSEAAMTVELAVAADPAHERTFALIKPDAYPRYHRQVVKHIVERGGLAVVAQEEVQLTEVLARQIYRDMADFPTFTRLIDFVTSGPALALVLEGANAVAVLRSLAGPTNPKTARFEAPNSLRAKFGQDAQMNAIHASKDLREARLSIDAVFYSLLGGNFHIIRPDEDPLAAVPEPHMSPLLTLPAEDEEASPIESEAIPTASEPIPTVSEAEAPEPGEQQQPSPFSLETTAPTDESCLVSQMETLAVAVPEDKDVLTLQEEPAAEKNELQAAAVDSIETGDSTDVDVPADQLAAPLTPPQTRAPAGEKTHPLGNRLASSPFLQADRQLSTGSPPAPKRVGRIKSPFLGNGHDDPTAATVFAPVSAAAASAAPEPCLTNGGSSHENGSYEAGAGAEAEAEPLAEAKEEPAAEAKEEPVAETEKEPVAETKEEPVVKSQKEPVAEPEKEDAQLHEKLAELQLDSGSQAKKEKEREKEQQQPTTTTNGPATKAPATPQRNPPSRTAVRPVPAPAPASATGPRTVRRTPATGPAGAATTPPSAATAARRSTLAPSTTVARRTTLGPSSTPAARTRPAPATPATPSVTTRSAARAATGTTPAKAPAKAPAPAPAPSSPSASAAAARRAAASAVPAASSATVRSTSATVRSTSATVRSTSAARPAVATTARPTARAGAAPVTPTRPSVALAAAPRARPAPATPAATATTPTGPKRTSVLSAASSSSPSRATPGAARTTPTRVAPTRTTALARTTPASSAAAASPRPVTRSMSTTVEVSSTASSRARAAAAAAAKAGDCAPRSAAAAAAAAPGAPSRPSAARPSAAASGAPIRAGVPARPARAAAKPEPETTK